MSPVPIVAIRSNDLCFLGILRSCGVAGRPVVPVTFSWDGAPRWHSERSRYFESPHVIANPAQDEMAAVGGLLELGERLRDQHGAKPLLVPSSDTNLMLLQAHQAGLSTCFAMMGNVGFDGPSTLLIDKARAARLYRDHHLAAPVTIAVDELADIESAARDISFPCVYKPTTKDYVQGFQNSHRRFKAVECPDPQTLRDRLTEDVQAGYSLIVQEKIPRADPGDEVSVYVYADRVHRLRMVSMARKVAEYPAGYGTGLALRLCWHEQLVAIAQALAKAASFRGMMEIEFMRDSRDGRWKIIEVNPRPWLLHHFQTTVGLNFMEMLAADAARELAEGDDTQRPSPQLLSRPPAYVDLGALIEYRPDVRADLRGFVDSLGAPITFARIDREDPGPGESLVGEIAARHGEQLLEPLLDLLRCRLSS